MASKSKVQTAVSYQAEIVAIPIDAEFRRRDVEVLDENESLFQKLCDRGILVKAGWDDDGEVRLWTVSDDMCQWLPGKSWFDNQ